MQDKNLHIPQSQYRLQGISNHDIDLCWTEIIRAPHVKGLGSPIKYSSTELYANLMSSI